MIVKKNHKELLSLWGIKDGPYLGTTTKDLTGSWSCPHCTYLNNSFLSADICAACANVCASRRYEIKRQQVILENCADRAAESLSQQNDLLNDLNEDNEDGSMDDDDGFSPKLTSHDKHREIIEYQDFRSIAPTTIEKQLQMVLLPDLLLDCLAFLGEPQDIINIMLVCKFFSGVTTSDTIWWPFQSRFINDPSSPSESAKESLKLPSSSTSSSSAAIAPQRVNPSETWICSRCQLTQALASSTQCEMCLEERPSSSSITNTEVISTAQTAFVIVKSVEHLAALWVEGNKLSRERENNLKCSSSAIDLQMKQSACNSVLSSPSGVIEGCEGSTDPLTGWAWHAGLPGPVFSIDRARAAHTVRPHCMAQGAGKWFYRCKVACLERKYRTLWQSIHRGWEWIRNDLRSRLRQKWALIYVNASTVEDMVGDSTHATESSLSVIALDAVHAGTIVTSQHHRKESKKTAADPNYQAYHTCSESAAYVKAIRFEAESLKESLRASETLRKALRKLTSLNWVLCYESIKAELSLQAEGLALDLRTLWGDLGPSSRSNSMNSSSRSVHSTECSLTIEQCQLFLDKLNRACAVFISWADELEENSCSLNDEIAKDTDRHRDTVGLSTKAIDEYTGMPISQGTPSISDMAMIALRNHGLLSNWIADSVLQCVAMVGAHADTDIGPATAYTDPIRSGSWPRHPAVRVIHGAQDVPILIPHTLSVCSADSVSQSPRSDPSEQYTQSISMPSSLSARTHTHTHTGGGGGAKKRPIDEVHAAATQQIKIARISDLSIEVANTSRQYSVKVLLQLYDLCEVLDVEDDLLSSEQSTQALFKRRYMHTLCALPCLAKAIRTRNNDLDIQASRNRSNQWDGDDVHFSYTRDRGSCRDGPFDPHRDRMVQSSDCITDQQAPGFRSSHREGNTGSDSGLTTHVLKVKAISSCESFHSDFDPKSIRRRQLIELYA